MTLGKWLRTVRIVFRSILLPLLMFLLSVICKSVAYSPEPGNSIYRPGTSVSAEVFDIVMTVFFPIVLFALVSVLNGTDDPQTERFLARYNPDKRFGKEKFIFTSYEFYAEMGGLLFVSLVGNTKTLYGYITDTLFGSTNLAPRVAQRNTLLVLFAVMLAVEFLARCVILSKWYGTYGGIRNKEWALRQKRGFIPPSFWGVLIVIVACFGFSALSTFYLPQIVIALQWPIGKYLLRMIPVFVVLILFGILCRYLRAFSKRRKFLRDLQQNCRRFGVQLLHLKHPYLSLFYPHRGIRFTVVQAGQKYDCKLVAGIYRNASLTFSDTGEGLQQRDFYILRFRVFSIQTRFHFGFESDGEKIVIINPIPKKIYASAKGSTPYLADTAEPLGDYTLYNASGFFAAMERKILCYR